MPITIAELLVRTPADAGIQRIWGVTGDSLNSVNWQLSKHGRMTFRHVRQDEATPHGICVEDSNLLVVGLATTNLLR